MTAAAWVLLGATSAFAVLNWIAVETDRRSLELVCKPATLVALVGVAVALDPNDPTVRAWFVAALVCSLAGDVFLMFDRFQPGVAAFALAHLAYGGGFVASGLEPVGLVVGAVVVAAGVATLGRHIVAAVRRTSPEDAVPVTAYVGIISVMVLAAWGSLEPLAIAGALIFYASDACIAWSRFIDPFPRHRLAIMSTYHVGQALLVLSLLQLG
jgi:uncharacterized membrane protein YhhN